VFAALHALDIAAALDAVVFVFGLEVDQNERASSTSQSLK